MTRTALLALAILGLLANPLVRGNDEESIRSSFASYWEAFRTQDYAGAADQILPEDLVAAQKELLPLFLTMSQRPEKDLQDIAAVFFGDTPEQERSELTPLQVYEGLNRFVAVASPGFLTVLKTSTVTVDQVLVTGDDATVHYKMQVPGYTGEDKERYTKKEGKWWLRVKEDPKETAKKFQSLLEQ